jgi:hypothetical protein
VVIRGLGAPALVYRGRGHPHSIRLTAFGLFFLLAGRSETIRGLRGDGRDERFAQIDLRATAITGLALLVALIVAWLVAITRGQSGNPYGWLLATGGLSYLLAVVWFRWRG